MTTRRPIFDEDYSVYETFERSDWARLRSSTPMTLSEKDLETLRGVNEQVSMTDVEQIYLPLSRLLNLHFRSARSLDGVRDEFLGRLVGRRPYVIAVAGSVAVGKSTFARVLQALLARWPDHPQVALVTTDGFLYPNAELARRDLMSRKGFPESYDRRRMIAFLAALKAGQPSVYAPVYSHEAYDILPERMQQVQLPDILIFEGLNVLQVSTPDLQKPRTETDTADNPSTVVSDYFDFSIYVDADEQHIETWYVNRFLKLHTVFKNPNSYFHHYRDLSLEDAAATARNIWREINLRNLRDNIRPTRGRANVVLVKRADHSVDETGCARSGACLPVSSPCSRSSLGRARRVVGDDRACPGLRQIEGVRGHVAIIDGCDQHQQDHAAIDQHERFGPHHGADLGLAGLVTLDERIGIGVTHPAGSIVENSQRDRTRRGRSVSAAERALLAAFVFGAP
ncbi:MAG: type I pantothenate kinase [Burkholderiaceae bacterium]